MRNFANKIWNASRFLMMNLTIDRCELPDRLELEDKWILSKLNSVIPEVTENMERYELGVAAQKVYDFIWDDYCDWYIELTKTRLQGRTRTASSGPAGALLRAHRDPQAAPPFMPFITEGDLAGPAPQRRLPDATAVAAAPGRAGLPEEEKAMELIMDAIRGVRARRAEMNVPLQKAQLTVSTLEPSLSRGFPSSSAWPTPAM